MRIKIHLKNKLVFICLVLVLGSLYSCKYTLYRFNNSFPNYIIQKGNQVEFYSTASSYYPFPDSCNDLDNNLDPQPGRSFMQKIEVINGGILFKKDSIADTLFLKPNVFQFKKKIFTKPFFYFDIGSYSNGKRLGDYGTFYYDVKYIKDSCFSFLNYPMTETHVFEFYPNSTIKDTNEYHKPIRMFLSKETGIPLSVEYFIYEYDSKKFFTSSQSCFYVGTYRGRIKKLKRVLF